MTHSSQLRPSRRAPRVNLRGTVSATIQLENGRQHPSKLYQLSISGGLLELAMYLEERTRVGLTFQVGSGTMRPKAEMLFPMRVTLGYMQPFRFTDLRAEERQILGREITELLGQTGLAPGREGHGLGLRPPRFYLESF